jgi:hypothetical protein
VLFLASSLFPFFLFFDFGSSPCLGTQKLPKPDTVWVSGRGDGLQSRERALRVTVLGEYVTTPLQACDTKTYLVLVPNTSEVKRGTLLSIHPQASGDE